MKATVRRSLLGTAVLAGALLALAQTNPEPTPGKVFTEAGRYQLMQGNFPVIGFKGNVRDSTVFKIDSQTGRTWTYLTGIDGDGKPVSRWSYIQD
jgi:hypothetical protein